MSYKSSLYCGWFRLTQWICLISFFVFIFTGFSQSVVWAQDQVVPEPHLPGYIYAPFGDAQYVVRRTEASGNDGYNPWGLHGNVDYYALGVESWFGTDFKAGDMVDGKFYKPGLPVELLPEGESTLVEIYAPFDSIVLPGFDPDGGYDVTFIGTGIWTGWVARYVHMREHGRPSGSVKAGDLAGYQGSTPSALAMVKEEGLPLDFWDHLHLVLMWCENPEERSSGCVDVPALAVISQDHWPRNMATHAEIWNYATYTEGVVPNNASLWIPPGAISPRWQQEGWPGNGRPGGPTKSVDSLTDLAFVVDISGSHALSKNVVGKEDLSQRGIFWHQTATGPVASDGRKIDGMVLVEIEKNIAEREGADEPPRPGYNVLVGTEEIVVRNETYAIAWILVPEAAYAWHAVGHNLTNLSVSFVDVEKGSPPTPAQLRTMYAVTVYWMQQYDIPPDNVKGHKEVAPSYRGDPVGVDMNEVRRNLRAFSLAGLSEFSAVDTDTIGTLLDSFGWFVSPEEFKRIPKIDLSPQLKILYPLCVVLLVTIPLVLILIFGVLAWSYDRSDKSGVRSVSKPVLLIGLLVSLQVAMIFIGAAVVYTPIVPRSGITRSVEVAVLDPLAPQDVPTAAIQLDEVDWVALAEEAEYKSPALLKLFVERAVPRGVDGFPLALDKGGKVFPPFVAAAFPYVETNTAAWREPDPRNEGPWGHFKGWKEAPGYYPRTVTEITQGKQISRMAQACRAGLTAIAENPYVKARYPGLEPQDIWTAKGCEVGRGQILAVHFAPNGMFADLKNKDVWSSDAGMVEMIYIYLVSQGREKCGGQSWYQSGNIEAALCSYNPRSWGVASRQWYWDGLRRKTSELEEAWKTVVGEPVVVSRYVVEPTMGEGLQSGVLDVSSPYAFWDTAPALALRVVRQLPDTAIGNWLEKRFIWFGQTVYNETNAKLLGFE